MLCYNILKNRIESRLNMKKNKKKFIIALIVIIIIGISIGIYYIFFHKTPQIEAPVQEVKVMNEIEGYGYKLDDRDTELFKTKFNELKELLENNEEIDKEKYASLLSQMFIIDLYTINNKNSKYDIGGLEFLYNEAQESFKSVIMDTIYKTVVNNLDKKRDQELPEVSEITVKEITPSTYKFPDESEKNSYIVKLEWDYVENLGYDTYADVELIENDNKLEVVSLRT